MFDRLGVKSKANALDWADTYFKRARPRKSGKAPKIRQGSESQTRLRKSGKAPKVRKGSESRIDDSVSVSPLMCNSFSCSRNEISYISRNELKIELLWKKSIKYRFRISVIRHNCLSKITLV